MAKFDGSYYWLLRAIKVGLDGSIGLMEIYGPALLWREGKNKLPLNLFDYGFLPGKYCCFNPVCSLSGDWFDLSWRRVNEWFDFFFYPVWFIHEFYIFDLSTTWLLDMIIDFLSPSISTSNWLFIYCIFLIYPSYFSISYFLSPFDLASVIYFFSSSFFCLKSKFYCRTDFNVYLSESTFRCDLVGDGGAMNCRIFYCPNVFVWDCFCTGE